MKFKRFFVKNIPLQVGTSYELGRDHYNYMINVIRLKQNGQLILCNNTGYDFLCSLEEIEKNKVIIKVLEKNINKKEARVNLTVCQALVKNDKFELIAQKITELGASGLIGFESKFTAVKAKTNKLDRLEKITENASRQCGRANTLKINKVVKIDVLPELLKGYDLVLLAYENNKNSLKEVLKNKTPKNIAIIIGSEGGFTNEEALVLEKEIKNLKTVSLGKRILRAETASIALAGIVMYELGEI